MTVLIPAAVKRGVSRLLERAAVAFPFLLLIFVVGVQLGIARGRELAGREDRPPAFLDTTCTVTRPEIRLGVTATAYSSTADQTDSTPSVTAAGTRTRVGVLAVSRDLLELLPYGTRVFVVEDTMARRWRHRIDFWMPDRGSAVQFGLRQPTLTIHGEQP